MKLNCTIRSICLAGAGLVLAGASLAAGKATGDGLLIWYDQPASVWTEALPVGNGNLGAMVHGGLAQEHLQFNQDTLWTGSVHQYQHEGAYKHLGEIRRLLRKGEQEAAETLAMEEFMSIPLRQLMYQPFGDIWISFDGHDNATGYRRMLDLETAEAVVQYSVGDVTHTRRTLSSYPDNVLVEHLTADSPGQVTFAIRISTEHEKSEVLTSEANELVLSGQIDNPGGLRFAARLKVVIEGGSIEQRDGQLHVKGADSATILLSAATGYVNFRDISGDPLAITATTLERLDDCKFSQLRARHQADYQELFSRVSLDLGTSPHAALPTDQRLQREDKSDDPQLIELLFQYGRYLLISSSRPGSQPANLQGIWNDRMNPPWGSKYTLNINAEMNYWPAEVANLPECAEPLFGMIRDLVISGQKTARAHYAADGWVVHHNTDLWRGSAPINHANHGIWPGGAAWLSLHLWERYLYSMDSDFLEIEAYPVMKAACEFYVDFLEVDPETGWLVSGPSNSPEQGGLVIGPTMDHQLIRSLFRWTAEAAGILGTDTRYADFLLQMSYRIAPNTIGRLGQLQEWLNDVDDPNNRHRHVSHLWGVFPGKDITWKVPDMMRAARQSLLLRGDGGTGWALGWKVSLWARFLDGNHAHKILMSQLNLVRERPDGKSVGGGGVYPNLFDAHPPFQIDGNFAATAGVCEMLLQSHEDEIILLPALPDAWPDGSISGIRARGGFTLDISWRAGQLDAVRIFSENGGTARIRYGDSTRAVSIEPCMSRELTGTLE